MDDSRSVTENLSEISGHARYANVNKFNSNGVNGTGETIDEKSPGIRDRLTAGLEPNLEKSHVRSPSSSEDSEDEVFYDRGNLKSSPYTQGILDSASIVEANRRAFLRRQFHKTRHYIQMGVLVSVWMCVTVTFMFKPEHVIDHKMVVVPPTPNELDERVPVKIKKNLLGVTLRGNFVEFVNIVADQSPEAGILNVQVFFVFQNQKEKARNISSVWQVHLLPLSEVTKVVEMYKLFKLDAVEKWENSYIFVKFYTTGTNESVPLDMALETKPIDKRVTIILASLVLVGFYVLIICDLVNHTFAAIIASTTAIGVMSLFDARPSMTTIIEWISFETLMFIFSMMIIVAIFSDTGVFDYLAVFAYKTAGGKRWPLIASLCFITCVLSAVLNNVTMILVMTPIAIRLCEIARLMTTPVLIFMILFSNIGGAMTPVGDSFSMIITLNNYVKHSGVTFLNFFLHVMPCVIIVSVVIYWQLRCQFRRDSSLRQTFPELDNLYRSVFVWRRMANNLKPYSGNEDKVRTLIMDNIEDLKQNIYEKRKQLPAVSRRSYEQNLQDLEERYRIRNKTLLIKSTIVFVFIVLLFCQSFIPIGMHWAALLGAMLLLILAHKVDISAIMGHIQWSPLIFFAAIFVLMEAMSILGLFDWVTNVVTWTVHNVALGWRSIVGILFMLWFGALLSAFMNSVPFTTMMIKIMISLNEESSIPTLPLVWALILGTCLGSNGTLIGSLAGVICASVANHHGYKLTFIDFFQIGFPVTIVSILISSAYLLIMHLTIYK